MRKHATIILRLFAALTIVACLITRCTGQAPEIPTYPTATTNAVTLQTTPTYPVASLSRSDKYALRMIDPAQEKYNWKRGILRAIPATSLCLVSGAAGGLREGLLFRKAEFFRAFPNASHQYWDRDISYQNQRLFGAARDGYHDLQYLHTWTCYGSGLAAGCYISAPIVRGVKRPPRHIFNDIALQAGGSLIGYVLGSIITFNLILHK